MLEENILIFHRHVIMDKKRSGRQPRRLIDLTHNRQLALEPVIEPFATRIRWNTKGELTQMFPWRYWPGTPQDKTRPVSIAPDIMSGKLVITGTRIPVEVVAQRTAGGETVASIARDYRLTEHSVEQALRHLVPKAA